MSKQFISPFAKSLYDSPRASPGRSSLGNTQQAKQSNPSTPTTQFPSPLPQTPVSAQQTPTGRWSHPAVSKISEVQSKRAPNDTTLRRTFINLFAIFLLYKIYPYVSAIRILTKDQAKYLSWSCYATFALLAYNVVENMRRFWWTNTFEEYPLTPNQRKLLNLPASPMNVASSATITPPRYQKTFTPSPASNSPLSGPARRNSLTSVSSPSIKQSQTGSASPLTNSPHRSVSLMAQGSGSYPAKSSASDFGGSTRWRFNQSGK